MTCSSFLGLRKKSGLLKSSETLFYDKTMPGGSYCAAFGCSSNSYQKSGKFTGYLLAIYIMQSVRPGENETSGITAYICFYSKEPGLLTEKVF